MKIKDYTDIDVLEAYLLGDLDPRDMYEVEKLSLSDPFVGEALEGLRQSKQLRYHMSLLQKQLHQKVAEKPVIKKRWQITSHRLSIASAAAVLLITVSILFWMKSTTPKKTDEVPVVLAESADVGAASVAMAKAAVPFKGVQGLIKDANTGQPVAAAKITLTALSLSTTSADNGRFKLSVQEDVKLPVKVLVTAAGYQDLQINADNLSIEQTWLLKPAPKN